MVHCVIINYDNGDLGMILKTLRSVQFVENGLETTHPQSTTAAASQLPRSARLSYSRQFRCSGL